MKRVLIGIIKGYKKYISPSLGANCRFTPTCSEYAIEAIETWGALRGGLLAVWRVLRCNPFGKTGYDPVPKRRKKGEAEDKKVLEADSAKV